MLVNGTFANLCLERRDAELSLTPHATRSPSPFAVMAHRTCAVQVAGLTGMFSDCSTHARYFACMRDRHVLYLSLFPP